MFPALDCHRQWYLPVGDGHQLYVEESGNPQGVPVVVLHGGPGGSCSPYMRRFFDPQRFRIILFDQRGAGQSLPLASIENNTSQHLIADLETLRRYLNIDRWWLFGGSWGSTLALMYGASHPDAVLGMILRGIFLCRDTDLDWLYTPRGAARLFPQAWDTLVASAPQGSGNILMRYGIGLEGEQARSYARQWCNWESLLAGIAPLPSGPGSDDELCVARQEVHYFLQGGFLPAPLLTLCAGMTWPVEIVHGTHDFVCPAEQAWLLHQVLPNSRLHWVEGGSHAATDPKIAQALVSAVASIA